MRAFRTPGRLARMARWAARRFTAGWEARRGPAWTKSPWFPAFRRAVALADRDRRDRLLPLRVF